jgi:methyltransferase
VLWGWPLCLALLVGAQRLAELALSAANGRRLRAAGAVEVGAGHYPLIVGLQVAWLLCLGLAVPPGAALSPWWLGLFLLLQMARLWVIATLGRYWTTRVYHLPDVPLVRRGPYRLLKHPNYVVMVAEVVVLPLVVGAWWIALLFGPLQALLLWWRIHVEERALATRRGLPGEPARV